MKVLKLTRKHLFKIILTIIGIILLILTVFAINGSITADKDKKNRTFLERDNTTIVCNKGEKIGNIKIEYSKNNNKDKWNNTILLYCTIKPNITENYTKIYSIVLDDFFHKFEKKMNLYNFSIIRWDYDEYSKEWDRKYPDGYFIN